MAEKLGKVISITELHNLELSNSSPMKGANGSRLGIKQMLNSLIGYGGYDGYSIKTDKHEYLILIDNGQCCCENWGYFSNEDDTEQFIGKELIETRVSDTSLNSAKLEEKLPYGVDSGSIQFVDFCFSDGSVCQFAVYNEHNGYYGHPIIFAKDNEIILNEAL